MFDRNKEKTGSPVHPRITLKELYSLTKQDIILLTLASVRNLDAAFLCLERVFKGYAGKTARLQEPGRNKQLLLKSALHAARRLKKRGSFCSKLLSADESTFMEKILAAGEKPMQALILKNILNLDPSGVSFVMRCSVEKSEAYCISAQEMLTAAFPGIPCDEVLKRYALICEKLSDSAEVWGNISFYAQSLNRERRYGALGIAAILILAVFGVREAYFTVRAWSIPAYVKDPLVLTELPDSADYWENQVIRMDEEYPNINKNLMDALHDVQDDALLRADFTFYDRDQMLSITEQGFDLESLYVRLFENGADAASVNRAISLGILEYFKSYKMPWMPETRDEDFASPYKSIYESTRERLAQLSGQEKYAAETAALKKHPEIFSDEHAFNSYMYSMRFISEAPLFYGVLSTEYQMRSYLAGETELTPEEAGKLRDQYETEIFAFYKRTEGSYEPLDTAATYEELEPYFMIREHMAERLREELEKTCKNVEGISDLMSEYRSVYDISAFSAVLTKSRLLELAKNDGRFKFYGVALDKPEGYPQNIENELALTLALQEKPNEKYIVYRVDDEYVGFSINYWVPYRLPEGFIEDLRDRIPLEGSAFELQVGYYFTNGVGHKAELTRLQLLREIALYPDSFFYSYNNYFRDDT